ncbi:hypothetical protein E5Q_03361 [Mixia osmundae IAM 14324]|uniref:Uncharacterized protein n=1 Tax=Mixia osmundae (strain CBS 9802 / IAM 14324 / JCM 22182 / KY 12970) TaxID=764103 RepID=G7E1I1_MIXOS|nr:hypothetical protein E5Q_03361 [Mixia osmundae IAM 14324]
MSRKDAMLALELRLSALESLIGTGRVERPLADLQSQLAELAGTHDDIANYLTVYDSNAALLEASFAAQQQLPASLSLAGKASVVTEAEQDLRETERSLREIETHASRDVHGQGQLARHTPLKASLERLGLTDLPDCTRNCEGQEARLSDLLHRFDRYTEIVSQVFVHWSDLLDTLEKQHAKP